MPIQITVVGSINLDFVATGPRLPAPGETVTGAVLARHPGGKGANQALAARRLGAEVRFVGRVGRDPMAADALRLLQGEGVDLSACEADPAAATGVALIAVAASGENQIIVAPGANAQLLPRHVPPTRGALICQLELPAETVAHAVASAPSFVCVNLAPAKPIPEAVLARADLVVVNESEAAFYGAALDACGGLVARTLGARGARLTKNGAEIAAAEPPPVDVIDTTGAGDCFVAALVCALLEGQAPADALRFACAAAALSTTRPGAQPAMPARAEVEARL